MWALPLCTMNQDDDESMLVILKQLPTAYKDEAISSPDMLSEKQKTNQISRQWHQDISEHSKKDQYWQIWSWWQCSVQPWMKMWCSWMCFLLADHAKSRSKWSTKVSHDLEEFLSVIKGNFKRTAKIKELATRNGQASKWWKERVRGIEGKYLRRAGETIPVA